MSLDERDPGFEALLDFLKRSRGFDFTGYKRPSLERRFRRRMDAIGCRSYGDYLDYLEVHPEEYEQLFDTLLINVTEFFRDPATWEYVRDEALPALLAAKPSEEPVRVWCAGCASGQETYTVAMLLAETPRRGGLHGAREDLRHRRRRGRAEDGAAGPLHRQGGPERPGALAHEVLRTCRQAAWAFARTCDAR